MSLTIDGIEPVVCKDSQPRLLSIKATSTLYKPADQLHIQVGVVAQGATALKALQENNKKIAEVIKSLQGVGLSEKEYQTGHFSIRPIYAEPPQPTPANWHPYITGFEVTNSLAIQTEQLKKAGELIDQVTQAGANSIDNIQFTLKDPRSYRKEAIAQAALIALEEAQALATATRSQLKSIFSLSVGEEESSLPRHGVYLAKAVRAPNTSIISGDIEVSASVSIGFEIE